ncbi:MAG TPA: molecular chaperone [Steroidobacteraceae bacterium]|jgi:fimbrial chaperone protein|nr:molecular chaperone [Steroidobacteraceae bacterium]
MKAAVLMNTLVRWLLGAMIGITVAGNATAGTFSISPLRIELDKKQNIGVLTIHNDEDAPLLIQAQIVAWSQQNNEEIYSLSKDLLVTPPVIQLAPKSDQIVRVALRHVELNNSELHYRLILNEVPPEKRDNFNGLSVALRMSIPIFIKPGAVSPDMKWTTTWTADGSMNVEAYNAGTAHLQVTDFELQFGPMDNSPEKLRVNPSRYVLPGSRIKWTVKPPATVDHNAAITIHGYSDQGEFRVATSNADVH